MSLRKTVRIGLGALGLACCLSAFANTTVQTMVIFGDSLSDIGNTTHLLKSLRKDENPSYLVRPLKTFVINKMTDFANDYYVPQMVLDSGIGLVTDFFDNQLGPLLADIVGKVKQVPVLPGRPYWHYRFSNGPVWNEYLANMLHIDMDDDESYVNKAFGGSWTSTYDHQLTVWNLIRHPIASLKSLVIGKLIPPSLGLVVQAHLLEHPRLDPDAVYFVFTGGNDYLNMLNFEDNYDTGRQEAYVDNVLNNLSSAVQKLIGAGAKRMVILGAPRVGDTPKFSRTQERDVLNLVVDKHNQKLEGMIQELQANNPGVDLLFIDLQSILGNFYNTWSRFGLMSMDEPCIDVKLPMFAPKVPPTPAVFKNNSVLSYAQNLQEHHHGLMSGEKNYHVCDDPEDHFFWDEVHPSTLVHQALAFVICDSMRSHGYKINCDM